MENILIIKTGAAGDIVRTTSLLNILQGNIYWVIADKNRPLLPTDRNALVAVSLFEAFQTLKNVEFDHVISLEEDKECARLATEIKTRDLTGIYINNNEICYSDNSACWFDMSQVSKLGLKKANILKAENRESYQSIVFSMLGNQFNGEAYRIFKGDLVTKQHGPIGIEKRTGRRWPNKQWGGYEDLVCQLQKDGRQVKIFEQKQDLREYLKDISECSHIVSGDTLAMHVAMAYNKTCSAIFNCTSPQEIYDYGLLTKLVSPYLHKYFYATTSDNEVITSVTTQEVYDSLPATI